MSVWKLYEVIWTPYAPHQRSLVRARSELEAMQKVEEKNDCGDIEEINLLKKNLKPRKKK